MRYLLFAMVIFGVQTVMSQIRIDHAITVVSDMDMAKNKYNALGFYVKDGRLHENGLLNAHIKFANQSSFELMTVKGIPKDPMSQEYQSLLENSEGGVFLALTGHHHDSLKRQFTEMDIDFIETEGKLWRYLSFPSDSYLAHLFFIDYQFDIGAQRDLTNHSNGLTGIQSVEMEGDDALNRFFENIGLEYEANTSAFLTPTGRIAVVASSAKNERPRLARVIFSGEGVPILEINWRM